MRSSLAAMKPYKVKPEGHMIRLDNNEAFRSVLSSVDFSQLEKTLINRYPAESSEKLVEAFGAFSGFPAKNILPGNGSDELISLICQWALDPKDRVLVLEPDFSMYEKNAVIMGAEVVKIGLQEDFTLPMAELEEAIFNSKAKLLFLSNPNNPTGMLYPPEELERLISGMASHGGIVILDEAYMDFAGDSAFEGKVLDYENAVILRTASKALGMAALRLGFLIANNRIIDSISCIKPPYNVNTVSAEIGRQLLEQPLVLDQFLLQQFEQVAELEEIVQKYLSGFDGAIIYPSSANFFLIKLPQAKGLFDFLYEKGIKIRLFEEMGTIRISAGSKEEHELLKQALAEWKESAATRSFEAQNN